jgi:beta-galactosidase
MKAVATRHDGSRPVSIAPTGAIGTGGLAVCDVVGYNYMDPQAEAYHKAHPNKPVIGTETVSAVGTRGIYITDYDKGFVSSYDPVHHHRPRLGRRLVALLRRAPSGWPAALCGPASTIAASPRPTPGPTSARSTASSIPADFPRTRSSTTSRGGPRNRCCTSSRTGTGPDMEGKEIAVWVHSNMDKVELFLNGQSLGIKEMKKDQHLAWNVKYAPGVIEARGYKDGKLALTARRETTGARPRWPSHARPQAKLLPTAKTSPCSPWRSAMRRGALFRCPTSNNVTFKISGSGRLIGVGNGDPTDHDSDKGSSRKAFGGLCMASVNPTHALPGDRGERIVRAARGHFARRGRLRERLSLPCQRNGADGLHCRRHGPR